MNHLERRIRRLNIARDHWIEKLSLSNLSRKYGLNETTICKAIAEFPDGTNFNQIELELTDKLAADQEQHQKKKLASAERNRIQNQKFLNDSQLIRQLLTQHLKLREIGKVIGVSASTILRRIASDQELSRVYELLKNGNGLNLTVFHPNPSPTYVYYCFHCWKFFKRSQMSMIASDHSGRCRECNRNISKRWRRNNPEKYNAYRKQYSKKLSMQRTMKAQCSGCKEPFYLNPQYHRWAMNQGQTKFYCSRRCACKHRLRGHSSEPSK